MSEYQYYEFRTIDHPLTEQQREYVASLSSRAYVTSHMASFVYNYGDFRGNTERLMADYFDIMLYMANWGSRRLIFRLPCSLIDREAVAQYCLAENIDSRQTPDQQYLLLDIHFHDEELMGWTEGEGWLDELVELRQALLHGDVRVLYLAWLKAAEWAQGSGEYDGNIVEPPVPAGLGNLSPALNAFMQFIDIDADLVTVAAQDSDPSSPHKTYEDEIPRLPVSEQQDFLVRLSRGEPHLSVQLNKRLAQLGNEVSSQQRTPQTSRRTIGQLLESSRTWHDKRVQEEQRQARLKRERELDALAPQQEQIWQDIEGYIEEKNASAYKQAVKLLTDLHDLANYQGHVEQFRHRLSEIQHRYPTRSGLLRRIRDAKLL